MITIIIIIGVIIFIVLALLNHIRIPMKQLVERLSFRAVFSEQCMGVHCFQGFNCFHMILIRHKVPEKD